MICGADLKAEALEAEADLDGVGAGVPDVGDLKAGHELEGRRPIDAGVVGDRLGGWPSVM